MTLHGAIADLQAKALRLPDVKAAPDLPPETMHQFPFAVTYPTSGQVTAWGMGYKSANVRRMLVTEVHFSRQILPRAVDLAMRFEEPFIATIAIDPTLDGNVRQVRLPLRIEFGHLQWAGVDTIGYRFQIDVELEIETGA